MEYKSHRVGGVCAGTLIAVSLIGAPQSVSEFATAGGLIFAGYVGSFLPDIDHGNSKISREHPVLSAIAQLFLGIGKVLTTFLLFFCFWIPKRRKQEIIKGFSHRGVFHSLIMVILLYLALGLIPDELGELIQYGVTAGYVSHLLMDMMTVSGVKLLYPLIMYPFHIPFFRLRTSKQPHEWTARITFCVVTLIIMFLMLKV